MIFREAGLKIEKLIQDNSPVILTAIGVVGTVTTAILTGKATFKAAELIQDDILEKKLWTPGEKRVERTRKENFQLVWMLYIPSVASGVLTVACVVMANRISASRAAALAAAYSMSEKRLSEYKDKVAEKLGVKQEKEIQTEIAQDRVKRNESSNVIILGTGKVLFYDIFTDRYFESTVETVKKAQNDINFQIQNDMYASLGAFYSMIGLKDAAVGEELGWNNNCMMELDFSAVMTDDGRPCIAIDFHAVPVRGYSEV